MEKVNRGVGHGGKNTRLHALQVTFWLVLCRRLLVYCCSYGSIHEGVKSERYNVGLHSFLTGLISALCSSIKFNQIPSTNIYLIDNHVNHSIIVIYIEWLKKKCNEVMAVIPISKILRFL